MALTGVVLAGGLSSRLGHDKVRLKLSGASGPDLLARSVQLLESVCDGVLVIGREQSGYRCHPDKAPGHGPVGGITTALEVSGGPCLLLSCDLPFMEAPVLERLIEAHAARPEGALTTCYRQEDTGHKEALVAVYEYACLPLFQACVDGKLLKISRVVPEDRQHYLHYSADESLPFFNINYPADLELARRMIALLGR